MSKKKPIPMPGFHEAVATKVLQDLRHLDSEMDDDD